MTWSQPEYQRIAEKLQAYAGFVFSENRHKSTEMQVTAAMKESGFADLASFEALLQRDENTFLRFVDRMVIGETYFQREQMRLDFVKSTILPQLKEQRSNQHCFKIWSAGCSTGEEAYTLAALMIEAGLKNRFQIIATDISTGSLQKAQAGKYSKWSFRGVEEKFLNDNFSATSDGGWLVKPELRQNVAFRRINLMDTDIAHNYPELGQADLIFCRNVLIYFNTEVVAKISKEFFQCLSTGGWLVTGASDPVISPQAGFETIFRNEGTFHVKPTAEASKKKAIACAAIQRSQRSPRSSSPRVKFSKPSIPVVKPATSISLVKSGINNEMLAEQFFKDGKWQAVLDLRADYQNEKSISLMVRSCSNLGKSEEAELHLSKGLSLFPLSINLLFLQSMLFLQRKEYEESLQTLKKIVYLDRSIASVFVTMAFVQEALGDSEGAIKSYRNALKLCAQLTPDKQNLFETDLTAESIKEQATNRIEKLSQRGLVLNER